MRMPEGLVFLGKTLVEWLLYTIVELTDVVAVYSHFMGVLSETGITCVGYTTHINAGLGKLKNARKYYLLRPLGFR